MSAVVRPVVVLLVLGVAVTFGLTVAGAGVGRAAESGPEMVLSVKAGGVCANQVCTFDTGGSFTLSVEIVTAPSEGYTAAQSWVMFGDDITYNPAGVLADEIVWPDCEQASAVRSQFIQGNVSHGCLTGLSSPQPPSSYAGNLVDLSFNCSSGPSSTRVELLPLGNDVASTSGAGFKLPDNSQVAAKVSNLTINCGEQPPVTATPPGQPTSTPTLAPGDTPGAPTVTPDLQTTPAPMTTQTPIGTAMLTSTPAATGTAATGTPTGGSLPTSTSSASLVGDASCDGVVNPLDAALILQFSAGLIPALPCPGGGDPSGDGVTNPLDAALILQFSAGLISSLPP